jgi:hypothetical protein
MLRKGYVEEQAEALGIAIARLLGLRTKAKPEEVRDAIKEAAKELTGLDVEQLAAMPEPGVLTLLSAGAGRIDGPKGAAAAEMLAQYADTLATQGLGENPEVRAMRARSLMLLCAALAQEPAMRRTPELMRRTASLLASVPGAEQSDVCKRAVAAFVASVRAGAGQAGPGAPQA